MVYKIDLIFELILKASNNDKPDSSLFGFVYTENDSKCKSCTGDRPKPKEKQTLCFFSFLGWGDICFSRKSFLQIT